MTEMQKPKIIREDIEIVKSWEPDEYGNILITVEGKEKPIKIAEKRKHLTESLYADTQYKFCYANYMNRDYVADIQEMEVPHELKEQVKAKVEALPEVVKPTPSAVVPEDRMTKADWADKDERTRTSIERQKSLDLAVQWGIACKQAGEKIKSTELIVVATIFEGYIRNGTQGQTKES